jgi:O-glycosyl hydrolase
LWERQNSIATMHLTALAALVATPLLTSAAPSTLEARQSVQKVTVNPATKYQTIDGFGFSAAFQRANLIVNLQEPKQSQILNLLFNTTSGAGFCKPLFSLRYCSNASFSSNLITNNI